MTKHEKKAAGKLWRLPDLRQTQTDTSDIEAFAPPTPSLPVDSKLAELMLDAAIPKRFRRQLARGEPICLSVTVPGPTWCASIANAAEACWPASYLVTRDGLN